LYERRFGRSRPQVVMSIEERARAKGDKKSETSGQRHCAVNVGEDPTGQDRAPTIAVATGERQEPSRNDVRRGPHDVIDHPRQSLPFVRDNTSCTSLHAPSRLCSFSLRRAPANLLPLHCLRRLRRQLHARPCQPTSRSALRR
jgi:hypothetical protein